MTIPEGQVQLVGCHHFEAAASFGKPLVALLALGQANVGFLSRLVHESVPDVPVEDLR